jgi:hypothetical protein
MAGSSPTVPSLGQLADLKTPWCVRVAVTLGVAEVVEHRPRPIADIADSVGCDPEALHRVLRHLARKGLFEESEYGVFVLADGGRALLEPQARLFLGLDGIGGRFAQVWSTMPSYVRTGQPAYHEVFGRAFWDDLGANPDVAACFDEFMDVAHSPRDGSLPLADGWDDVRTVVDVGGGTGALLEAVLRAHPHTRGTLVDLPATAARARERFAGTDLADRVETVGEGFFDALPAGADLYLLSGVINDWPDPEAVAILTRCAEAARPAGTVVVLGNYPEGDTPRALEIEMLLVGGKDRSRAELGAIATRAGLVVTAASAALVELRPA